MAINLGSTAIADAKLGTTQVEKIYLGSEQIWGGSPIPTDPDYGEAVLYGYTINEPEISVNYGGDIILLDKTSLKEALYDTVPATLVISGNDQYDPEDWQIDVVEGAGVDAYMLSEAIGLAPDSSPFQISFTVYSFGSIDIDTMETTTNTLSSAAEFNQYTCTDEGGLMDNGIPIDAVKEFRVGKYITSTPHSFLKYGRNLESFSFANNSSLTSIGSNFLSMCDGALDQDISVPVGVTSIDTNFLLGCSQLNHTVTLPSTLSSIGASFMGSCTRFNQPITIPNGVANISNWFMDGCSAMNSVITLPNTLTSIGACFLQNCTAFNKALTLPDSLQTIGASAGSSHFMKGCASFAQSLTIPSGCSVYRNSFMNGCNSFTQLVANGGLNASTTGSNYALATTSSGAVMYTTGVTVTGSNRTAWLEAFPNRTSSPYRKLIDGGA